MEAQICSIFSILIGTLYEKSWECFPFWKYVSREYWDMYYIVEEVTKFSRKIFQVLKMMIQKETA